MLQLLELVGEFLLTGLLLLIVLALSVVGLLGEFALLFAQFSGGLFGVIDTRFELQTFHQFKVLVELFFKVRVLHLEIFKLLLHLLLVGLLHESVYLLQRLLHLVAHQVLHHFFQLTLFFHYLFTLLVVFILQLVVLLHGLLHLLQFVLKFLLLVGEAFQLLFVLPVEFLFIYQLTNHLVDLLLYFLNLRYGKRCLALHIGLVARDGLLQFLLG